MQINLKSAIITFFLLFSLCAKGQVPSLGIKGGANISILNIDDIEDENSEIGFHSGIVVKLPLDLSLFVQPELLYSQKGANAFITDQEVKIKLNYLELPVMVKLRLTNKINIHGGPYASYLLSKSIELEDPGNELIRPDREDFHRFDFGIALGAEYSFLQFDIGFRYNSSILEVGDDAFKGELSGLNHARNNVAQVYVVYNLLYL